MPPDNPRSPNNSRQRLRTGLAGAPPVTASVLLVLLVLLAIVAPFGALARRV